MYKRLNEELNRLSVEAFKEAEKIPLIVILDNVRSQHNIGSVFRTSDAFLVKHLYLCGITACPPQKEIHKTALGATETVDWSYVEQTAALISQLKADGFKIYAIEQAFNSVDLEAFSVTDNEKVAVIFGNEVDGVSDEVMQLVDGAIEISQYGTKHSLNISVCAGIVIYHLGKLFKKF